MRRAILFFIFALSISHGVFAQPAKPAPPKSGNYILKQDGFRINFPAKPTRNVSELPSAFGKANMVNYELGTAFAFYGINYVDFPTVATNEAELKIRFDAMKSALLAKGQNSLMSEKEIYFGEHLGAEYVFEGADFTATVRGLFVKQRFFQITVVTKGKNSKATQKVRNFNQQRVEQFFNSFAVTELPEALLEIVSLPADFGIKIQNSLFRSEFFGATVKLPENWFEISSEQVDVLKDIGQQNSVNAKSKGAKILELSMENTKILAFYTKSNPETSANEAVFAIAAERTSLPNFLPLAVAKSYIKYSLETDDRVTVQPSLLKINNVEFAWVETENPAKKMKQRFYVTNRKGIAFEVLLQYKNAQDLDAMLKSVLSVRFDESK